MKRLIIMLVGLSFFSGLSGQKPDFAYPEKVSANASASFEKAMKEGDELTGLRNLMDFYIARLQKGTEEQNAAYTFLSEKNDYFKTPVFRSLLIAFRARILTETYRRNRWKMDQRETPLQPFPASISEWSGEQMRFAIDSLCNDALSASSVLREVPVTQYPSIVTVEKQAIPFYPSLLDFVVSLSADRPDRPDSRMTPAQVEELVSLNPLPDKGFPVIDGYSLLLEDRSEVSPAVVQCALSRLNLGCRLAGLSSSESRALKEKLYSMLCTASGDPTDESAGLVLSDILSNVGRNDEALGLYSRAKKYLAKWPEGLFSPNIKAFIAEIEGPSALVRFPSVAYPGHTFDLDVNAYNLKKCKVEFFKANIPFGALLTLEQRPKIVSGKPYKTVVIDLPDAEVGREVQIKKEVELPEVGAYLVTLNFDGMSDRKRPDIEQINVSAFTLFAFGVRNYSVLVADGESGKGIGDVDLFSKKNNSSLLPLGKTSADGMYEANSHRISGRNIYASKGLERYS
ncbi:MAG: hypothetical protein K2K55_05750, partial [Duncaniella sp.]|nr:hypothetical protein [Duncaniella sp.]